MRRLLPLLALLALPIGLTGAKSSAPTIATVPIPGPAKFTRLAREIIRTAAAVDPSLASGAGLFDDALRVPHLGPAAITEQVARVKDQQRQLRRLPWRSWDEAVQVEIGRAHV